MTELSMGGMIAGLTPCVSADKLQKMILKRIESHNESILKLEKSNEEYLVKEKEVFGDPVGSVPKDGSVESKKAFLFKESVRESYRYSYYSNLGKIAALRSEIEGLTFIASTLMQYRIYILSESDMVRLGVYSGRGLPYCID